MSATVENCKNGDNQTDGNASFLRAARAGNVTKVLEYLDDDTDINTSNSNGLTAFHLSSKEGHKDIVEELIKRGANIDAATKKGNTALHIASLAGQSNIVKILVEHGANVNVQSQNGFSPLYMAAQENHESVVRYLLSNSANQNIATEDGFTPLAVALQQGHDKVVAILLENDTKGRVRLPALHIAARKDDSRSAALLLQNGHNVDVTSKSGFTPLHIAAHYGHVNVATLILQRGASVDYRARNNITPMHVAGKWGKVNMVSLLLEKGADIESRTKDGLTPLHCAARSGHDQVVDLLLEKGAPIAARTKSGLTPLHMAAQGDHVDSARLLLYHKAPVDDVTVDYLTPLHVSAHCGHHKVAKLLLDRKATVDARAMNGFTALHIAVKKNRIKVIELLLKYGASIHSITESGLTPLHVAAFMGHVQILLYLIQHGANVDTANLRGETPMHLAARANQTEVIKVLLRNGASVDPKARENQTPLHVGARLGNVEICQLLLEHGASPDAQTKDGYSPLHIAAREGHCEAATVLLDHGASLSSANKKGFTPLHVAAKYGQLEAAKLMLARYASPDAVGKNGLTPLHVATHYNNTEVALLLLEQGASPHSAAKNGFTPLHIAAKKNQLELATTLLQYGAQPNTETKHGVCAIHLACHAGHHDMVKLLMEHQADPSIAAKNGLTPLHLCAQEDQVECAKILVDHGVNVDTETKTGYTPLHVACHYGNVKMVQYLIERGANVNTQAKNGFTPLHQAAQQGHVLLIQILIQHGADPDCQSPNGMSALAIARRLGYISVVDILMEVTTVTTIITHEMEKEKLKVQAPETMMEDFMSESEDEEELMAGDHGYLTMEEMKDMGDDSLPRIPMHTESLDRGNKFRFDSYRAYQSQGSRPHSGVSNVTNSSVDETFTAASITETQVYSQPDHYHSLASSSEIDSSDNTISRMVMHGGFLVSFMVDARGGTLCGSRHSGVRVVIPPRRAQMPTRVTCRFSKRRKMMNPPPLMEGEALAARVIELGPAGAQFLGPVMIEVPHFASLRGREREIIILRSDSGETWKEHTLEATEEAIHEALNCNFEEEDLEAQEDLHTKRICRILTTDFPRYFAIVSRIRQETAMIGSDGGMISSTVVPQVQAIFPEGTLKKTIKVGLQVHPVKAELVKKILGNRVMVSPIITIEPRRRKFHKPITVTIPIPNSGASGGVSNGYSSDAPTLRLLCSITGGTAASQWDDITGTAPLTFVNDCVSFTTTVSARFWLMDCRQINEAANFARQVYREVILVPYMAKFVVFAKRHDMQESRLRVFCMTDDKVDKTLENQEHFSEVARSRDVEVLEGKPVYIEFAGNLSPVQKSGDQLHVNFFAFRENRLPFFIRVKDMQQESCGRLSFMKDPRQPRGQPAPPAICNLNIALPEFVKDGRPAVIHFASAEIRRRNPELNDPGMSPNSSYERAMLRLQAIAEHLGPDWKPLAKELGYDDNVIDDIQETHPDDLKAQGYQVLHNWAEKAGINATGPQLQDALKNIGRDDINSSCMGSVFRFDKDTDDLIRYVENAVDRYKTMDQPGEQATSPGYLRSPDLTLDYGSDMERVVEQGEFGSKRPLTPPPVDEDTVVSEVYSANKRGIVDIQEDLPTQKHDYDYPDVSFDTRSDDDLEIQRRDSPIKSVIFEDEITADVYDPNQKSMVLLSSAPRTMVEDDVDGYHTVERTTRKITRVIKVDPDGTRREVVYEGEGDGDADLIKRVIGEAEDVDDEDGAVRTTTRRVVVKKQIVKKTVIKDGQEAECETHTETNIEDDGGLLSSNAETADGDELRDSLQQIVDSFMTTDPQLKPQGEIKE